MKKIISIGLPILGVIILVTMFKKPDIIMNCLEWINNLLSKIAN